MSAVQLQECAVNITEKVLKERIYHLQDQMVNFSKQLRTVKQEVDQDSFPLSATESQPHTWLSRGVTSTRKAVCSLSCVLVLITWPLLIPLLIYFKEGCSLLFWKSLCLAILYVAAFTLRALVELKDTIVERISNVLAEIKGHCDSYYRQTAGFKHHLLLLRQKLTESWHYGSKDPNAEALPSVCTSAAGYVLIAVLMGSTLLLITLRNMEYLTSSMIFLSGFLSGLVAMRLKPQRDSVLLDTSHGTGEKVQLPGAIAQCSVGCELCCHTAFNSSICRANLPRTPPPTYQEALLSSVKEDVGSQCRSFYCNLLMADV